MITKTVLSLDDHWDYLCSDDFMATGEDLIHFSVRNTGYTADELSEVFEFSEEETHAALKLRALASVIAREYSRTRYNHHFLKRYPPTLR